MKKIVKWGGRILMLAALVFLLQRLWTYRESLDVSLDLAKIFMLTGCCLLYVVTVCMCPIIYKTLLHLTTKRKLPFLQVANIYCKSNILKYLPGNVMQYVGRNQIAIDEKLPHGEVALATLLEIGVVVVSAGLVAIVFSWSYAVEWVTNSVDINPVLVAAVVFVVMLVGTGTFVLFRNKIKKYFKEILTKKNFIKVPSLILYHALILIISGIAYFSVMGTLQVGMAPENYLVGIGLYSLAFVLGYITPGVPGGIGIRETILVYFFSPFLPEAQVLTGALLFRIISVLGDFLAWIAMAALSKRIG